jgi:hypothetical protein
MIFFEKKNKILNIYLILESTSSSTNKINQHLSKIQINQKLEE